MRYVRFRYRRTRFTSLTQINQALERVRGADQRAPPYPLRCLSARALRDARKGDPQAAAHREIWNTADWKDATLHPDCYVYIEGDYYSAPHIHRHKKLRIKITENQVEIFLNLERLAIHPRSRHRTASASSSTRTSRRHRRPITRPRRKSCSPSPDLSTRSSIGCSWSCSTWTSTGTCAAARASYAAARRRSTRAGHEVANVRIAAAIATMRRYDKYRVPYFQALLAQARKQTTVRGRRPRDRAPSRQPHAALCRRRRSGRRR